MERIFGLDRRRRLPVFHRATFDRWLRKREKRLQKKLGGSGGKVALFYTCSVNYNYPEIGKSASPLLTTTSRSPAPSSGAAACRSWTAGTENAKQNMPSICALCAVDDGHTIVVAQPTCGYVLKVSIHGRCRERREGRRSRHEGSHGVPSTCAPRGST
jgi:Fe-S oxidoreductase